MSGTPLKPIESLERSLVQLAARTQHWVHRHPRRMAASVLTLLLGTGVTAFGVAPLAPDAAELPRRMVAEPVTPLPLAPQLDALIGHRLELNRSGLTRGSDTADSLLGRLGVVDREAAAFLRQDPLASELLSGRPGKMVQARTGPAGELTELVARYPAADEKQATTHFTRLRIVRDPAGLRATSEQAPLSARVRLGSGTIRSSLFATIDESGLPDTVATQIAEIFSNEIDFRRDLRRGDTFTVLYEALEADGEPIVWNNQSIGRVLAAEFTNAGKTFEAVWFQPPGGQGAYFDFKGESMRRAFLSSPMEFSRVTSGFAMRFHPIHQTWRAHLGVDYGAPTGTPVRVVGDGVVDFSGVQNGYGNVIHVRHSGERVTVYAHLSRIDVNRGERVSQGQLIGAVGATGWATGPHLHFEFREKGVHVDPLKIARASEALTISPQLREQFQAHASTLRTQLAVAHSQLATTVASAK